MRTRSTISYDVRFNYRGHSTPKYFVQLILTKFIFTKEIPGAGALPDMSIAGLLLSIVKSAQDPTVDLHGPV